MHFHRTKADVEPPCEQLVRHAGHQALENFPLARGQGVDPILRLLAALGGLAAVLQQHERSFQAAEQDAFLKRLFDEVDGPELHRAHGDRNLAMTGHHDHRPFDVASGELGHYVEAVDLRHADVEENRAGLQIAEGLEEIGSACKWPGIELRGTQHKAQRTTHFAVVVHNIDVILKQRTSPYPDQRLLASVHEVFTNNQSENSSLGSHYYEYPGREKSGNEIGGRSGGPAAEAVQIGYGSIQHQALSTLYAWPMVKIPKSPNTVITA